MDASRPRSLPSIGRKLGELLVEAGLVESGQIDRALQESRQTGEPLGKILLKRALITEDQLGHMLSAQAGTDYVQIGEREFNPDLIDLFPQEFLSRHKVLPLRIQDGNLYVAMVHPNDVDTLDEIRFITGLRPKPLVTTSKEFDDAYQALVRSVQGQVSDAIASIRMEHREESQTASQQRLADEIAVEDQPVVRLLNSIFHDAVSRGASDVHIESREKVVRVRHRIDGVLVDATDIPKDLEALTLSRLKIMGSMDIAEKRRPQDGRSRISVGGRHYDLRINVMPNIWGEKAVVRILRPAMLVGGLDNLGLYPELHAKLKAMIDSPYGIVLVTGPTGSGKTTTLYSALYELNSPDRNLLTVEDPVEYPMEGICQTQANPKAGLSFADALRAMLRQDPDVIMVGEIRDQETLNASVFAALTGHLVLSTIHTNDAASTPSRMMEMGLPAYLLTSALRGIIAQRLVRKLCPHCREAYTPDPASVPEPLRRGRLYRSRGCSRCQQSGFVGRVGLFEILPMTHAVQELINQGAPAYRIQEAAQRDGMEGLAEDALRKVYDGITTPTEVARALGARWTETLCQPTSTAPST
ncbi:Flp pilus assembly complex ATPase component TadA [bacterium]|nr:Flp pilus assembly complex ATPase component TadA [bacterium]